MWQNWFKNSTMLTFVQPSSVLADRGLLYITKKKKKKTPVRGSTLDGRLMNLGYMFDTDIELSSVQYLIA